ncbi:THO complex subunit 2 [Culicoides brevitarsis]|uniref:THO complex subunit 2 n=1 Tax=Culicoides brevitarsis TaxID=469753 RepID=UPI00307B49D2
MSPGVDWNGEFDRNGRQEFLKHVKQLLRDDAHFLYDKSDQREGGVSRCIYQLVSACTKRQIKLDAALNILTELAYLNHDMPSVILDVFGILDAETSLQTDTDERHLFCQIVKEAENVLSENLLKERMEIDTLQDVGTVKNRQFYTRFIKVKTKLYYKQRRFNLFREESEGYAKLITELNQEANEQFTVQNALEIIKSLIGCFNLDPNRVLDIIIESFEMHPNNYKLFTPLLQNYVNDGNTVCEVLGYKYRHFSDSKTPDSLFKVTALLLQHGVFELDSIYSWLGPDDAKLSTEWKQEMTEAKEYVRKLNIVSINKEKEAEPDEEKFTNTDKYAQNQKWRLCEALLDIGDYENALKLMKKLPDHSVMVNEPIAKALAKLINIVIEPIYRLKCSIVPNVQSRRAPGDHLIQLPLVTSVSKLKQHAFPMFIALGPSLHYDPILLHKLIRLMTVILNDMNVDSSVGPPFSDAENESLYYDILTLLDVAVLPALSYMDCNCCLAEEIWDVVKLFPYQFRYSLYGRWKNDTFQIHPKLIRRRGLAQKQIKAIMKRVSKENVKPVARQIGKLSHCSPGFLFEYILLQIQIYDNLIGPVVDSLKYLSSLSFDVLGYCLTETLAQADRARLENDGTSLSLWLQSLASFCGAIFKKYNIELNGLLQYVANQLKGQKSLDLLILKEIVQKMTGIEAAEEMTVDQVRAMCGGEILRGEAGYFAQVRNTKKSSQRLKDALASNDLAVALALLIAQQKHCVIYRETTHSHLKLVGKLYDQCQDTLVQFGTFLGSNYSVEEYIERLPSIHAMLQEYHIHADVAFFLARPMFAHAINQKYDQLRKSDPNAKKLTTAQKLSKYLEATQAVMAPVVASVHPLHTPKVWEDISPQFLCTFWSLSMYDLQVPGDAYTKEIQKLKLQSLAIMDNKDSNASKNKKEQERFIALMEKLSDERKKQQEHVDKILHRLNHEKDTWFPSRSFKSAKNETITQFLQLCLFPRCSFTALDALYCAKFVQIIHSLKTTNFSTLLCYDRIFCDITFSVTSCTENEATRYGRFLCAMLETIMRWHMDEATFNKECSLYPGFVTKFRVSNQFSEANDHVGYENYRHVCHKWHYKITKSLVFCLDSKDYMQIRNSLIILMKILPHFPVLSKLSQIIEKKVEKVREEEKNKRQDLFILASSYIGQLKAKSSQMMRESDFHQVAEKPQAQKTAEETAAKVSEQKSAPLVVKKEEPQPTPVPLKESKSSEKKIIRISKPQEATPDVVVIEPHRERDKESRHDRDEASSREASVASNVSAKHSSKDLKRAEKAREKEREDELRKRDKERRKNKRATSPSNYDSNYYRNDPDVAIYEERTERGRDRERNNDNRQERDLSSVSNSSQGSIPPRARSMEPPEQIPELRESKRRKIEVVSSKKGSLSQGSVIQIPSSEGNGKREKSAKTAKRDKSDEAKELRREKKRSRKDDEVVVVEKRSRNKNDDEKQHKNGAESPSRGSKHRYETREMSPDDRYEHETRSEKTYKSRTRSGY